MLTHALHTTMCAQNATCMCARVRVVMYPWQIAGLGWPAPELLCPCGCRRRRQRAAWTSTLAASRRCRSPRSWNPASASHCRWAHGLSTLLALLLLASSARSALSSAALNSACNATLVCSPPHAIPTTAVLRLRLSCRTCGRCGTTGGGSAARRRAPKRLQRCTRRPRSSCARCAHLLPATVPCRGARLVKCIDWREARAIDHRVHLKSDACCWVILPAGHLVC
jgi:hypothetical protein